MVRRKVLHPEPGFPRTLRLEVNDQTPRFGRRVWFGMATYSIISPFRTTPEKSRMRAWPFSVC